MNTTSIAAVLTIALAAATAQPPSATSVILIGARVYASPEAAPLEDGVVVVESGRITAVGAREKVTAPAGIPTIDCRNLVVVAGFQNSHVHFTDPSRWADASSRPAAMLNDNLRAMLTQHGFTTVVDTASDLANTLALRRRIESGEVSGPRILTAGAALYPTNGVPYYVRDAVPADVVRMLPQPANPHEAANIVRNQVDGGADIVKLFTGSWVERGQVLPMPFEIASSAVKAAHSRGKLVFAHPSNVAGLETALRSGVDVLAHPIDDTRGLTRGHFEKLHAARVGMIPTLALFRGDPDVLDEVRDFSRLGGEVLFGTDIGYLPNFDIAEEYRLLASAGLGWREILASLTTAPARRFGDSSDRGRIAPGMNADLVVLAADPRVDVTSFARVLYTIRGGRTIFAAEESSDTTVAELKTMQQRLATALLARKKEEYAAMLAPEWRVTHIDGRVMTKADVLQMVFDGQEPPFKEAVADDVQVRMVEDTVAIVTGRSSFLLRDDTRIVLRFTDVVHKRDGRWVAVASHASPLSNRESGIKNPE